VARRIDIELTSARSDGTWTWRAAGALNPRGTLNGSLLYETAKAGDVVRAEAEFGIDGITVVAVTPPRAPEAADPNRIELIDRPAPAAVTTQLAGGRGRPGPDGSTDRRRGSQGGPHRGRPGQRPASTSPAEGPEQPAANGNGRDAREGYGDLARGGHAGRTDRPARPDRPARQPRAAAGPGRAGPRPPGPGGREDHRGPEPERASAQRSAGARGDSGQGEGGQDRQRRPAVQRQKRLSPGNAHRNAMLESLPVEQRPIAQQLLRGGIPAVRTALHFERERAREEGRPEPSTEGVLALAESLVSRVKAAEWRDRAEAAIKLGDDLAMRDLRSLVSGSDAARDEASRELVVTLREMLERRVEAHRTAWSDDVAKNLDEGHVVRALRLSSRPPDAAARFSAELATRLRDAASAALSPATPEAQWLAVLQAVVESPVRRTVKPEGLPANPSPELLETARQHCGRVPALAPLLGISVPPPPGPVRPNVPIKAPSRGHARTSRPARRTSAPPVSAGTAPSGTRTAPTPSESEVAPASTETGPAPTGTDAAPISTEERSPEQASASAPVATAPEAEISEAETSGAPAADQPDALAVDGEATGPHEGGPDEERPPTEVTSGAGASRANEP
jgi:hypothetical protein